MILKLQIGSMDNIRLVIIVDDLTVGAMLSPTNEIRIMETLRRTCLNVFLGQKTDEDLYRLLVIHGKRNEVQKGLIALLNSFTEAARQSPLKPLKNKFSPNLLGKFI